MSFIVNERPTWLPASWCPKSRFMIAAFIPHNPSAPRLKEMEELGYSIEHRVVATSDFLPQRRQRVWFVGSKRGGDTQNVFHVVDVCKALGPPNLVAILQSAQGQVVETGVCRKRSDRKASKWEAQTIAFVRAKEITQEHLRAACEMLRNVAAFACLTSREKRLLEAHFALCIKQRRVLMSFKIKINQTNSIKFNQIQLKYVKIQSISWYFMFHHFISFYIILFHILSF